MAHNLDITDGTASFVSARQDAWHRLGVTLEDTFTAEDATRHGYLGGWNLRKQPLLTAEDGVPGVLAVPDRYAVVRDNPVDPARRDVLGVVGESYTVMQNEELAELLNNIVDESGAHFETAGALDGGRRVFLTMKMPQHINIAGVDPVNTYLAVLTSHDGSMATTMMVTPVRVVCQNTLNMAFSQASNTLRVRHTQGGAATLLRQARQIIEFSGTYLDGFQQEAEQLLNVEMTQVQFDELIHQAFAPEEGAPQSTVTRNLNKMNEMSRLFADADTHAQVRNTAWAGLNALTEWDDHFVPVRPGADGPKDTTARAMRSVFNGRFKQQALGMVREFAATA